MLNITPPEGPTDCIELFLEKCLPLYFKKVFENLCYKYSRQPAFSSLL